MAESKYSIICPVCDLTGGLFKSGCLGCDARKVVILRSDDYGLSRKLQLQVLGSGERMSKILELVKEIDAQTA